MTHHTACLVTITGLDRQAGTNASARTHGDGQSVRVAHCWIDTPHTRAQRRAERHNRSHRTA
jgi:hypothetical protein